MENKPSAEVRRLFQEAFGHLLIPVGSAARNASRDVANRTLAYLEEIKKESAK